MRLAKLKIYSPFDSKLATWMAPFVVEHPGQAERIWTDLANDGRSLVSKHPKDYALFQTGEYCTETGEIAPVYPPVHFMSAEAVKDRGQQPLPLASGSH
jgi:hypothetical protein